jgi:hypothetical protein
MNELNGCCKFPSQCEIDYASLLSAARAEGGTNLPLYLREQLPFKWRDVYMATVEHQTNLVRFQFRTFEYICDLYSDLEATGEVPYDQTIEDRVVAVLGTSARAEERCDASRSRGRVGPTEELLGTERDKGHFMAHCIGGGLDVNVFSQERRLNRGWSPQGKIYRQMETYCYEQPGTLCFSRPVYTDGSSVPRWLEFGLLKADQTLWVEVFDN